MTPEAQRIAIAEACGWKPTGTASCMNTDPKGILWSSMPSYLTDLNAMHEAEKVLTDDQWTEYHRQLYLITQPLVNKTSWNAHNIAFIHATAAQRAEVFLRTLNLWTDK